MDIQAKFRITDPGVFWSLQTIECLGKYSLAQSKMEAIDDVYLDTKKRKLLTAGYYCRRRSHPEGSLITLRKLGPTQGNVLKTGKWHVLLTKNKNRVSDWPESEVRTRLLKSISDKKLRSIFTLHQIRITRQIYRKKENIALAHLDDVSIIQNEQDQQFKILKIKLLNVNGSKHLQKIVESLQSKWELEPENLTKFERVLAIERKKLNDRGTFRK